MQYTTSDSLLREFVSRGLVVISPRDLGIPLDVHREIFEREKAALHERKYVTASLIPQILQVLEAPGVVAACDRLVGKNWAIVPFTHNTPFMSGSNDQHWHKDDNGPYNGRKQRYHHAIQIEMLYYPQEVRMDMGPTATVPYSQYWTFNSEENHDNFAGADHLDFAYHLSGMERIPVSGPKSSYSTNEIVEQRTDHDIRMRKAVEELQWPMCHPFEVGPLEAGSVVLYSHNLLHRGNHRRDDWRTWKDNPRFMWRFWLYRTTDPVESEGEVDCPDWTEDGIDQVTRTPNSEMTEDCTVVWNYQYGWLKGKSVSGHSPQSGVTQSVRSNAEALYNQILAKHDEAEPKRIGAAYSLAAIPERDVAIQFLREALYHDRESVRRAASYGLVAVGPDATEVLVEASSSPVRWIRKASAFGLGEVGDLSNDTLDVLSRLLFKDPSIYVRSVAGSAFGSLIRRIVMNSIRTELLADVAFVLSKSLELEVNRLAMDKAQNRSIKLVRPTDDCDVCEGIGIDYGQERFEPVRSAVRENVLWSMVILCSHGARSVGSSLGRVIQHLEEVVKDDKNVFSVGFAIDALNRLANMGSEEDRDLHEIKELQKRNLQTFAHIPIQSLEPLLRGGLDSEEIVRRFEISERMRLPFEKVAPQLAKS